MSVNGCVHISGDASEVQEKAQDSIKLELQQVLMSHCIRELNSVSLQEQYELLTLNHLSVLHFYFFGKDLT